MLILLPLLGCQAPSAGASQEQQIDAVTDKMLEAIGPNDTIEPSKSNAEFLDAALKDATELTDETTESFDDTMMYKACIAGQQKAALKTLFDATRQNLEEEEVQTSPSGGATPLIDALLPNPSDRKYSVGMLNKTVLVWQEDRLDPQAGVPANVMIPEIVIDQGLVAKLCTAINEPPDFGPELAQYKIDLAQGLRGVDVTRPFKSNRALLRAEAAFQVRVQDKAYLIFGKGVEFNAAIGFLMGHEIYHVLFNEGQDSYSAEDETEADTLGLTLVDLSRASDREYALRMNQLDPDFSISPEDYLNYFSGLGYRGFLDVYKYGSFSEGDASHASIADRERAMRKVSDATEAFLRNAYSKEEPGDGS